MRRLILERTVAGRYREKEYALDIFQQHNDAVIRMVPPQRLLQYDIGDGWRPLCRFFGKQSPEESFPNLNNRTDFLSSAPDRAQRFRQEQKQQMTRVAPSLWRQMSALKKQSTFAMVCSKAPGWSNSTAANMAYIRKG